MIKISKVQCPSELTEQVKATLTQEYINTGKSVWRKTYIKESLLLSTHNKCAYCECLLNKESNYLEVEHFHYKDKYPDEVVEWDNLLPSCKRCNTTKGSYDTYINDFVNPSITNPKEHIILDTFLLRPITLAGHNTIEELNLNDFDKLLPIRYSLNVSIMKALETIYQNILDFKETHKPRKLNKIISSTKDILNEGLETSEYSALVGTLITHSHTFAVIKDFLEGESCWDRELEIKLLKLENNSFSTDATLFKNFLATNI